MTTLITGIAGGLAQRVATMLLEKGEEVCGVDYRAVTGIDAYPVFRASYNKTAIEDVFRKIAPKRVLHLGRIGNLSEPIEKRFELNVIGSQKLMNLCVQNDVASLVVLSTFHIYGAHPRNHVPISEDDPLRAGTDFPEIADAIQLDNMASTWIYKHPSVRTVVLRPTNVVGPNIDNTMCRVLRRRRIPALAGYNPMSQFVHEDDLACAVIAAAKGNEPSASSPRGVYNIAGPAVVPWRTALQICETRTTPIPSILIERYVRTFSRFPPYLIRFFKYPCVITDAAFRRDFGWEPRVDITETLRSAVAAARSPAAG
jgi:UDP-glucose 4-epimerase